MLWFLHLARDAGFVVRGYQDRPYGLLAPDEDGALAMTEVVLRPSLVFEGEAPSSAALQALHRAAHEVCFIARSVKTRVRIEEASESTARSGGDA
jgi:organic hydroperoxide reductase OsmC/OhrA